jgi:hypothetical protein
MNKESDMAFVKLGGRGFHQDLHRLCSVVAREHRRFNGSEWRIMYASQYAEQFKEWWPEFYNWVHDFQNQMELQLDG